MSLMERDEWGKKSEGGEMDAHEVILGGWSRVVVGGFKRAVVISVMVAIGSLVVAASPAVAQEVASLPPPTSGLATFLPR